MRQSLRLGAFSALVAAALPLAGCDATDPMLKEGLWHPIHVSRANLVMEAANPADLVRGHATPGTPAVLVTTPIERLEQDKTKKLIDSGLSDVQARGQGGGD
jgi:F420-0:gamma-glutamyl ligase